MSDKPLESGQEEPGDVEELPTPQYQEPSAGEQPSGAGLDAAKIVERLETRMDALIEKKLQSQKDKRWDQLERTYGDLSEVQEALAAVKAGGDPDAILQSVERKQLLNRIETLENAAQTRPSHGKSEADEAYETAKTIIENGGLGNDPKILEIMGGTYRNPADMLTALNFEILKRNTTPKKPPSGAAVVPPSGQPVPQQSDQEKLRADYEAERDKLRKGDRTALVVLKGKYRKLGLNIN